MPWLKQALFLVCSLPFLLLAAAMYQQNLGANPIETLNHTTGSWTLRFLLITLAMTPMRKLSGWSGWIRFRRMLGLFTFFYAVLHFLSWIWLDQQFLWPSIVEDVLERPYITLGFAAFLLLIPLALTSNKYSMRKLKRRWQALHKLVYLIAILGVLHYLWLVKADALEPLVYLGILMFLLLFRLPVKNWGQNKNSC